MNFILRCVPVCIIFLLLPAGGGAQTDRQVMQFKYEQGGRYRILTEVNEEILVNGMPSHVSRILNKVAVNTVETRDGSGRLVCDFQMSEMIQGGLNTYHLKEDYHSEFWRDAAGIFTIDARYLMPVVRNVPRFPRKAVAPGDTWAGEAEEVHDLRRGYGIQEPLRFPVKAHFTYLRDEEKEGVPCAVLKVEYVAFHTVNYARTTPRAVPVKITGRSDLIYWWDRAAGIFHSYHEDFDYVFYLSNSSTIEYRGTADGRLLKSAALDREKVADDLNRRIREDSISDTSARKDREGVTIVMDNVQFPPNSYDLTAPEKEKLSRIAALVKQYSDRDLMVTGHTARYGEERTSQILSEQRAMAVADFLISRGAIQRAQVTTRGMGSRQPAASNDTEEGMKRNRRVEITILEN